MNLGHTEGILLSSVLTCMIYQSAGDSLWLNLEDEMQKYVDDANSTKNGSVLSWGYNRQYSFWKTPGGVKKPPVTAKVESFGFEECVETNYSTTQTRDCMGLFKWSISAGINGSFSFQESTALPVVYEGLSKQPFYFNLNDLNITMEEKVWGDPPRIMNTSIFYANCKFDAEIHFEGYFAYFLLKDEPFAEWVTVSVTDLANASIGLEAKGRKLAYSLMGTYEERIWCDKKDNKII
uniref:Putative da-p36 protein n=1 Tax=Rhipicephalus pulchellus TaxID=72859 RepID=L7LQE0_RHIPC